MNDDLSAADVNTLALLNRYLDEMHAGQLDPNRWRAEHPDLAARFDCLDRLESIAPLPDPNATWTGCPTPPGSSADFLASGKFELLGELGRGGMGVVYKARQVGLERTVALKMILAGSLASDEQLRRFRAEAMVAAKVQHAHIVPVFETGQLNGLPYLVMQYVEGCSLAERLKRGPLPPAEAVRCVVAVARAVSAMHAVGIVHRDLKPSNILLDAQSRPYVTDFGLAKLVETSSGVTQSGTILGTPAYMAPEQATGRAKDAGPFADVYSLGAILYECLTGRPPFEEATPFDTLLAVLESEPPPPRRLNPSIPRVLEEVCLQCLDKQPQRRFASAENLAAALDHYLKGEPVPTRHSGVFDIVRRWARREPALASRLAALAAFSVIVQILVTRQPEKQPIALRMQMMLLAWAAMSWICQRGVRVPKFAAWATVLWSATDVLLLTAVQIVADAGISPLIVGYPFLIACAGLWTQVRMVWITTACTVLGYAGLAVYAYHGNVKPEWFHRHVIFLVTLIVLGFVMSYQVHRVRALSRYYEGG